MKSNKETIYILTLSEEERQWLRSAMQNPIGGLEPKDEPVQEQEMRIKFFHATDNQ